MLSQWGVRAGVASLRRPGAVDALAERGVPEVWRASISEAIAVIDVLDARIAPIDADLVQLARGDERARLLRTIPGVGWLLGLTFAAEIGDISRFASAGKLVGYSGLVPRVRQSGESSRTGRLAKACSPLLRWAAVEAAQHAWRPQNPWHRLYVDVRRRHGHGNAAKSAVAPTAVATPDLLVAYTVHPSNMHLRAPERVLADFTRFERLHDVGPRAETELLELLAEELEGAGRGKVAARLHLRLARRHRRIGSIVRALQAFRQGAAPAPDPSPFLSPEWLRKYGAADAE